MKKLVLLFMFAITIMACKKEEPEPVIEYGSFTYYNATTRPDLLVYVELVSTETDLKYNYNSYMISDIPQYKYMWPITGVVVGNYKLYIKGYTGYVCDRGVISILKDQTTVYKDI